MLLGTHLGSVLALSLQRKVVEACRFASKWIHSAHDYTVLMQGMVACAMTYVVQSVLSRQPLTSFYMCIAGAVQVQSSGKHDQ